MKRKSEQLLFHGNSDSSSPSSDDASPSHRSYDHDRDINGDKERERELDSEQRNHNTERDEEEQLAEKSGLEKINAKQELEAILRSKKPRIRVLKPMQKLHFTFNWVYTKDAVRDVDILTQNPKEVRAV